ncbi:MAG TPA: ABC transporter substrate-binding protein, partial [archaeon]|nr:ABC transporter substrate-binding protein [archaeon]
MPTRGISRRRFLGLGVAACAYLAVDAYFEGPLTTLVRTAASGPRKSTLPSEVSIGIVYPLSGRLEQWGGEGLPFVKIAEDDINDLPEAAAAGVHFNTVVRSSNTTGEGALAAVTDLVKNERIQVIAGLPTSGELGGTIEYLAGNHVATISSASTSPAPNLLQRDTVFRLMPSELYMAKRLAELSMHLGYRRAAIIHRSPDEWGDAYAAEVAARFRSAGYPTASVPFKPTHPAVIDYSSEVKQLSNLVNELGADEKTVVVVVAWEGEDLNIFHHAAEDPTLSSVRWLSAVLYPSLLTGNFEASGINLPDARDFAQSHRIWGQENHPPSSALLRRIWAQAKANLGVAPRFEHVYLYDSIQIAARALLLAGTQEGQSVAAEIPVVTNGYDSATG